MPATPLNPTHRYIPAGVRQVYWVPTILDPATPTKVELDAGTDLTHEIAAMSGFTVSSDVVDAPDLGTRFTSQVAGLTKSDKSSISFYNDSGSDDARSLLLRDTDGFVVIFPEGNSVSTPAKTLDVFPSRVLSFAIQQDVDKVAMAEVQFSITSEPKQNIAIPTT